MPGDRPVKMGSFGSHLDELVRVIQPEPRSGADGRERRLQPAVGDNARDRLFGIARRMSRDD